VTNPTCCQACIHIRVRLSRVLSARHASYAQTRARQPRTRRGRCTRRRSPRGAGVCESCLRVYPRVAASRRSWYATLRVILPFGLWLYALHYAVNPLDGQPLPAVSAATATATCAYAAFVFS
jgi:hypothetical protein